MDLSFRLPAVLMQERDGSQETNSRQSSWSLSPMDRYSKTAGAREELSPAQIKDRDHILLILKIKDTFRTIHLQRGSLEFKKSDVSIPIGLSTLARRCVYTHERFLRYTKYRLRTTQTRWLARGNPEEIIHMGDSNYHQGESLSEAAHVSTHTYCTLLPPNKHYLFYHFLSLWEFISTKLQGQALPLVTGLVARIQCFHCHSLTSTFGQEPKSCLKKLKAEATRDQFRSVVQFSSVQLLSHVRLFATPWTAAHQASLSITNSQSPPKPTCIELVMPSNPLILCRPLLLLPSTFPSIRVFSNESAPRIR